VKLVVPVTDTVELPLLMTKLPAEAPVRLE
jgi:hypothetical protein